MESLTIDLVFNGGRYVQFSPEAARSAGVPQAAIDAAIAEKRVEAAKTECRRRIYAVASREAQMNMTSAAVSIAAKTGAARTDSEATELADHADALAWVAAMRANVDTLASDPTAAITADANWPACPANVIALAGRY